MRKVAASLRELPPPSVEEMAHSAQLLGVVREAIAANGGAIDFAHYMQLALYAPGLGYYSAGARKFGEAGDFITAPELSPLFSRCVARHCATVLSELGNAAAVLEFGAGTGAMAADILLELERLQQLPAQYLILEVSADLRQRQSETLQMRAAHLLPRVQWLERLPSSFVGVVLANEVLDAMPVHRFRYSAGQIVELGVSLQDEYLAWTTLPVCAARVAERAKPLAGEMDWPEGYESEVNLAAEDWVKSLATVLERGMVLLFDYGFPRHEYYHPQRSGGTLMCHYRHRAHGNALILPGLQDLTAHVDFTAVAETALVSGLDVLGFSNQANFLLGSGMMELVQGVEDMREQLTLAAQLKRLMMPGEMGELFKVMALGRGLDDAGPGFAVRDERYRL